MNIYPKVLQRIYILHDNAVLTRLESNPGSRRTNSTTRIITVFKKNKCNKTKIEQVVSDTANLIPRFISRCCHRADLTLYGRIENAEQRTIIQQNSTLAVDGGLLHLVLPGPGRVGAPPSPLLAVPNITAHPSKASVPTSYHSMWHLLLHSKGLTVWFRAIASLFWKFHNAR